MKKTDKSLKIIISLIIIVLAFVLILALLVKFNVIKISQPNASISYLDNIEKEKLCDGIWYYYDEGISAYILLDETGTERQRVLDEEGLEYYKENPERIFENMAIFYDQNQEELEEDTIEE